MSAEDDGTPDRNLASRLKRRRARMEDDPEVGGGDARWEDTPFQYGYGGWTVTFDSLPMPEPVRQVSAAMSPPPPARRPRRSDPPAEAAYEPSRPVRRPDPHAYEEEDDAPEDRPLIVPPQPRRRPPVETGSRLDAPRIDGPRIDGPRTPPRGAAQRPDKAAPPYHANTQRILGGGTVMIGDELYPLIEWSAAGLAIRSEGHLHRIGDHRLLEIEIDLDDYAVNLDLEGEVIGRSSERTSWRFSAPSATQRQVLEALTRVSLSGGAPMLPLAEAAPAPAGGRRRQRGPRRRPGTGVNLVSFLLNLVVIALVAGVVISTDAYETAVILPPPPATKAVEAAVAVERVPLRAPVAGVVLEWATRAGESVDRDEPIVSLAPEGADAPAEEAPPAEEAAGAPAAEGTADAGDGEAASTAQAILSPCDCTLQRIDVVAGESVGAGEELATLYRRGTAAHVEALFRSGEAPAVGAEVTVNLTFTGETYRGTVESVGPPGSPDDFIGLSAAEIARVPGAVAVRIRTDPGLPAALAGDPAVVTVAAPKG